MSSNGVRKPQSPQIEMLTAADPSEAAAVVAAVEQFIADTAPMPQSVTPVNPWQSAALLEGVSSKQVFGPSHTLGPERTSPWQ